MQNDNKPMQEEEVARKKKNNDEDVASWTTVIWTSMVALIGFGFAIYRYLQLTGAVNTGENDRITRIELVIYRASGKWGVISVFILMGIVGLYYAISNIKELRNKK